jgi:hypothetical protein
MNNALAGFYGTGAVAKTSSADSLRELHLTRRVVEFLDSRGVSVLKASAADLAQLWEENASDSFGPITQLGGPEEGLRKASQRLSRIRAWQNGERDGAAIARHGIKASFERAQQLG